MSRDLTPDRLDFILRKIVKNANVELATHDGINVRRSALSDEMTVQVALPRVYGILRFGPDVAFRGAGDALDLISNKLHDVAASMRGAVFRDLLETELGVDIAGDDVPGGPSEHERCERLGTRLIEEGERLMRRAKEMR